MTSFWAVNIPTSDDGTCVSAPFSLDRSVSTSKLVLFVGPRPTRAPPPPGPNSQHQTRHRQSSSRLREHEGTSAPGLEELRPDKKRGISNSSFTRPNDVVGAGLSPHCPAWVTRIMSQMLRVKEPWDLNSPDRWRRPLLPSAGLGPRTGHAHLGRQRPVAQPPRLRPRCVPLPASPRTLCSLPSPRAAHRVSITVSTRRRHLISFCTPTACDTRKELYE